MQRNMKYALGLATLLVAAAPLITFAQVHRTQISEDEIKTHFSKADCEGVNINHLEYFDFTGDGQDEAVVLASTCATGTAGPDVHAVVTRREDGSLADLEIPAPSENQRAALFGSVFCEMGVKDGLLVETYHDESGRPNPVVIKYRWNGRDKVFQVADATIAAQYKASFDCNKATTTVENAICYSSVVAPLDSAVDQSYKTWLDNLNGADRDILTKEQEDWLRKRDLICDDGRLVFGCLETLYRARLLELEYFRQLHR